MNKEIGNVAGVSIMVNPETYEDIKKRKTIYENEILSELQTRIDKAIEYIKNNLSLGVSTFGSVYSIGANKVLKILEGEDNE